MRTYRTARACLNESHGTTKHPCGNPAPLLRCIFLPHSHNQLALALPLLFSNTTNLSTNHAHPTTLADFRLDPMHWRAVLFCLQYRIYCCVDTAGGCIPLCICLYGHKEQLCHVLLVRNITIWSFYFTPDIFLSYPAIVTAGRPIGRRHSMCVERQRCV